MLILKWLLTVGKKEFIKKLAEKKYTINGPKKSEQSAHWKYTKRKKYELMSKNVNSCKYSGNRFFLRKFKYELIFNLLSFHA